MRQVTAEPSTSLPHADTASDVVGVADWLQSRLRFRHAAEAIVHYTVIWVRVFVLQRVHGDVDELCPYPQRGDIPERIAEKICDGYLEHIDAAHAWLHSSLTLWEKADTEGEVSEPASTRTTVDPD